MKIFGSKFFLDFSFLRKFSIEKIEKLKKNFEKFEKREKEKIKNNQQIYHKINNNKHNN